ncbi:unnamed protein product [Prorocentrum cordatum]|uniref:Uncharacterized protein n=1 Tax=Prorocentrum cordatum TaxID=2364126 RepID=A0ABN9VBI6_9DINO|nr:unnamed protein product [Polarella glacialis]
MFSFATSDLRIPSSSSACSCFSSGTIWLHPMLHGLSLFHTVQIVSPSYGQAHMMALSGQCAAWRTVISSSVRCLQASMSCVFPSGTFRCQWLLATIQRSGMCRSVTLLARERYTICRPVLLIEKFLASSAGQCLRASALD